MPVFFHQNAHIACFVLYILIQVSIYILNVSTSLIYEQLHLFCPKLLYPVTGTLFAEMLALLTQTLFYFLKTLVQIVWFP